MLILSWAGIPLQGLMSLRASFLPVTGVLVSMGSLFADTKAEKAARDRLDGSKYPVVSIDVQACFKDNECCLVLNYVDINQEVLCVV